MSKINEYTENMKVLGTTLQSSVKSCTCLEQAAQKWTDLMYQEFSDSIVLSRVFATIPFGELPDFNQKFVTTLASSKNITTLLNDDLPVLSLLGSRGRKAAWNDRRSSQGHIGIPLASADFIESIPMVSRLLKELGVDFAWLKEFDTDIVKEKIGTISGLFYVPDAPTSVDAKGRKIIAAQDFVQSNSVKTVFGMGGGYLRGTIIVMIVFTDEVLEERDIERFMGLVNYFKSPTQAFVREKKIFV